MTHRLNFSAAVLLGFLSEFGTAESLAPDRLSQTSSSALVPLNKMLLVEGTHLIVPVCNGRDGKPLPKEASNFVELGIYEGDKLIQSFSVALPQEGEAFWLAAYPLERYGCRGKSIRLAAVDDRKAPASLQTAFGLIRVGTAAEVLLPSDYTQPYRNQFHASTRRGWNNDPNGMVFAAGKYHLYYQYNPFGIFWGNIHWGHLESTDLIHWEEKPLAIPQKLAQGGIWSGGGFLDPSNLAGFGPDTLFAAYTSQGGENIAYSKDGGLTFTPLPENPVVKHRGRDPKIIWYEPEKKWVMAVYDIEPCPETEATPVTVEDKRGGPGNHIAFYESKNLRQWTRCGAFTDGDRKAVFECPEMFQLPVTGMPGEARWILMAAENRYFLGKFDGRTFTKESGPLGTDHGAFYAAQSFSDVPDGRRIQMGWVRTGVYLQDFPSQITSQAFTLPHELTLRQTREGLRMFFWPVKETERLRAERLVEAKDLTLAEANAFLQKCQGELSEVLIAFTDAGPRQLVINGIDASFNGRTARIFTDRTFNEIYSDDGFSYELKKRAPGRFASTETRLTAAEDVGIRSLQIFRLKSIWNPGERKSATP